MSTNPKPKTRPNGRDVFDLLLLLLGGGVVHLVAIHYPVFERLYGFTQRFPHLQLEALFAVSIYLVICLALFSWRRWRESKAAYATLSAKNDQLQKALDEIRQLRGILPICASCKNIRDDQGFWHAVESYVQRHSDAEFTHSICPQCREKLYPQYAEVDDVDDCGGATSE
jgi:hypothetical protein